MSGDSDRYLARDIRYTGSGTGSGGSANGQNTGSTSGGGSQRPQTCSVCLGYCCGPNPYRGGGHSGGHNRGSHTNAVPTNKSWLWAQYRDEVIN